MHNIMKESFELLLKNVFVWPGLRLTGIPSFFLWELTLSFPSIPSDHMTTLLL